MDSSDIKMPEPDSTGRFILTGAGTALFGVGITIVTVGSIVLLGAALRVLFQ